MVPPRVGGSFAGVIDFCERTWLIGSMGDGDIDARLG
jgi:hypothetical protein